MAYRLKINGLDRVVDVDGDIPLLWVLRDVLGLTGTKFGCGMALCGACTIHLNGTAIRSCITPIDSVGAAAITTIEAIGDIPAGREIQRAWLDLDVPQCGYCQSGQVMSASALLAGNANPSDEEIDNAMSGIFAAAEPIRESGQRSSWRRKPLPPERSGVEHAGSS